MESEQKKAIIDAQRATVENELYAARIALELAEAEDEEALAEYPRKRVETLEKKMAILDEHERQV